MTEPKQLRKEILAKRNMLTEAEIKTKSQAIQDNLMTLAQVNSCETIFIYVSFRSEVATELLIDTLVRMGKTVVVPLTRVKEKRLDAIHITNRLTDLVPGYCNIPEPKEELAVTKLVQPADIETILLPGSVFDERGGRFGYGGGYYDRFLANVPGATRIGLAFELQMIEKAPLQDHDEILDLVVTESRIVTGKR